MSDSGSSPAPARPDRRRRDAARFSVVAVLAAALVLGGLIDRSPAPASTSAAGSAQRVPVAPPAAALSTSWFCAGATDDHSSAGHSGAGHSGAGDSGAGEPHGPAPGAVIIANAGAAPATGVVTLVPNAGSPVRIPVTIGPDSRRGIAEDVPNGAPWIGAIVDINAGAVAVEQQVNGQLGLASAPCATAGSSNWYFAAGATLINAGVVLSLLNPYATDAIVDLSFTTNEGVEAPQAYQGLDVPAGGLIDVSLGDHLRRRQSIATTVTARSGRLVAWKTDIVAPPSSNQVLLGTPAAANPLSDPASPIPGVTLTLGAPDTATTWTWPAGGASNGVNENYVIYNPGVETAQLKLSVDLDQGVAEPFDLSVGPDQVTTVVSSQEVRIPPGVGDSATLQSLNGVPVAAERTVSAGPPSAWSGLGELPGGQVATPRWLLAVGQADRTHDGWVVLYNPGSGAVRTVLAALGGGAATPLTTITIPGGRRAAINLNRLRRALSAPLLVSASGPVFSELDVNGTNGTPGIGSSFGVPLGGS
jgi:hypothetical protein